MAEKYELAEQDYKAGMKYKDIAEKYGVSLNTVKSWKTRKWGKDDDEKSVHTKSGSVHTKNDDEIADVSKVQERKRGGNPNPTHRFPKHNSFAAKHLLRSKFLHKEQIEIMEAFEDCSIADKVWLQLELKFAAIIRMQKIMWVENADDDLQAVEMSGEDMVKYKIAFAYERYETYIKAQARAMAEYRNLADSFLKHSDQDDERRFKLEKMELDIVHKQVAIEKTQLEVDSAKGVEEEQEITFELLPKKERD